MLPSIKGRAVYVVFANGEEGHSYIEGIYDCRDTANIVANDNNSSYDTITDGIENYSVSKFFIE